MAAMSTALTEFSDKENNRTWTITGHTVQKPRLAIEKRKLPVGNGGSASTTLSVVYGTVDATSTPLAAKIAFDVTVRYPINGLAADVTAALAVFRDIVASDEFTTMVNTQGYVKP